MADDLLAMWTSGKNSKKKKKKELLGKLGESLSCVKEAAASVISGELPLLSLFPTLAGTRRGTAKVGFLTFP